MINLLKFWYWRKYKNIPHPDEIRKIRKNTMVQSKLNTLGEQYDFTLNRKWAITEYYIRNRTINDIANRFNVTRERVRNIIWKFYWDHKRGEL